MVAKRIFQISLIAGTVGLIGLGAASAQGPTPLPGETPPQDIGGAKEAPLTTEAMIQRGDQIVANVKAVQATAAKDLAQARAARDVPKTLCVNNIVNQVNATANQADDRIGKLKAAAASGNSDNAKSDFTILTIYGDTATRLSGELSQCIGKEAGIVGDSTTTSTGKTDGDGNTNSLVRVVTTVLPCASCVK